MISFLSLASLGGFANLVLARATPTHQPSSEYCPVFFQEQPKGCLEPPATFAVNYFSEQEAPVADSEILQDAVEALVVLQEQYFNADYATWPTTLDWTAAVAGTVVSGMLTTLSKSLATGELENVGDWKAKENFISSYFAQVVGSYYGQDVLSIRGQAYDDILWVVLGWLETIKFVRLHNSLHYSNNAPIDASRTGLEDILGAAPWHGHNWVCSFAHRARIFWNLGARGWEKRLCNGGMVWNPRLNPYKNAITNELWISASISMYEDFPGDNFTAPWLAGVTFPTKDPAHLEAALEGYTWLMNVNMTNQQGLFVDGFHIDRSIPGNTRCDLRDEMVYTYNQGVLLTGQRGLWSVSGRASYLEDGHTLIQSVIVATGWNLTEDKPMDGVDTVIIGQLPPWRGLGRGGIMEEQCDASGTCSQDGQTFKGIFFHHLAAFCAPLDPIPIASGKTIDVRGYTRVKTAHAAACRSYLRWLRHNALAARRTRDDAGRFGMWWGAGIWDVVVSREDDGIDHFAENTTDYRNQGTPEDDTWGEDHRWIPGTGGWDVIKRYDLLMESGGEQQQQIGLMGEGYESVQDDENAAASSREDPNSRGRGRTVETQMGGLALLRAYWELSQVS